ncbi:hypothetical protein BGZ73_008705 [Actinomortierella ambigua]|nr:hypothetical protein BGZ73_008705 [Actinomortierella ambigua]
MVDIMPIEFSHRVIMACIEEIKLRGLRHKHLFRNVHYQPAVESMLELLVDPKRCHLFSVKMMRIDTVAGLLSTCLSRTYPPLVPVHIQEMFYNPNGRFFFELLGLLPELNRYLFVEILDLCCDLVDNHAYNQISPSKLAVCPGTCCFGLEDYMPNGGSRVLVNTNLQRFSGAFYHIIYAYREERDLSEEELQAKLDRRDRQLEEERIAMLERVHGFEAAHAILRMENRIAQGLPAESPVPAPQPTDIKEISLYTGRKERVVADDAISLLDIELDSEDKDGFVPKLDDVAEGDEENEGTIGSHSSRRSRQSTNDSDEEEEENAARVAADLKKSVSVAVLSPEYRPNNSHMSPLSPSLSRANISRFNTVTKNLHPVSPGDIFGISQHAIQRRELQSFLAVARTVKRRRLTSAQKQQLRRQKARLHPLTQRSHRHHHTVRPSQLLDRSHAFYHPSNLMHNAGAVSISAGAAPSTGGPVAPPQPLGSKTCILPKSPRRERTKKLRLEIEQYLSKGLSEEEAIQQRQNDRKQRRRAKKAQRAKEAAAEAAAAAATAVASASTLTKSTTEMTMEEAEVLEALDYLSDGELQEFMDLAGLTHKDIERIRSKAAAHALKQVTHDILQGTPTAVRESRSRKGSLTVQIPVPKPPPIPVHTRPSGLRDSVIVATTTTVIEDDTNSEASSNAETLEDQHQQQQPGQEVVRRLQHMTSMDMLIKNASMVADTDLRLYPTRPSSPISPGSPMEDYGQVMTSHGGLLSQAASLMINMPKNGHADPNMLHPLDNQVVPIVAPVARPALPHHTRPQVSHSRSGSSSYSAHSRNGSTSYSHSRSGSSSNNQSRSSVLVLTKAFPPVPGGSPPTAAVAATPSSGVSAPSSGGRHVRTATAEPSMMAAVPQQQINNHSHHVQQQQQQLQRQYTPAAFEFSVEESHEVVVDDDDHPAYSSEDNDDEEALELRMLLAEMSPEERLEFLRLSGSTAASTTSLSMTNAPSISVVAA